MILLFETNPVRAFLDRSALLRFEHFVCHPIKLFQDDCLASKPRHERNDERAPRVAIVERSADLGIQHASAAHAAETKVGLDDPDNPELAQDLLDPLGWVR